MKNSMLFVAYSWIYINKHVFFYFWSSIKLPNMTKTNTKMLISLLIAISIINAKNATRLIETSLDEKENEVGVKCCTQTTSSNKCCFNGYKCCSKIRHKCYQSKYAICSTFDSMFGVRIVHSYNPDGEKCGKSGYICVGNEKKF